MDARLPRMRLPEAHPPRPPSPQTLRSDAQDNRERILAAARELFAQRGIDVAMREIARRAEVGPATLYRRFPTRHILISEVFTDELRACRRIVEDGHADSDAWRGFCSIIERMSVLNVSNQGFVDAFLASGPDMREITAHRASLLRMVAELAARAKLSGELRADFAINDFVLVVLAERGLAATPVAGRESAARRFATLVIDGFRAPSATA